MKCPLPTLFFLSEQFTNLQRPIPSKEQSSCTNFERSINVINPKLNSIFQGLLLAQAAYHSASIYFEDADYVIQLTKSNIERWSTSFQKLLEAKYKSAGTAGAEASSVVEEEGEVEWSHSFIITPGSFPTFQDILRPGNQDTAASALLASDFPGSAECFKAQTAEVLQSTERTLQNLQNQFHVESEENSEGT